MDISSLILPSELLEHFNVTKVIELGDIRTKNMFYHLHLEEINNLPKGYDKSLYESKGFLNEKTIQDFPLRGKAVYLKIKRRRWRLKSDKKIELKNDYSFITEGSKLTQELSDFLKQIS